MTFGSVCSGIGAPECAWRDLGWRHAFASEIEPFPRSVLAHHYPTTPMHGDFTTIETGQYEPINLLVGGTPCQSFSVAGLRKGMADDRGNLALEYLRLADRLRPRWLVWENVPGVLSSNGGRDFGAFLGGLGQLGYGFAYRVLDAQFFGVAQRRRRVFVVGYLGDWRRAAAVLFEPASLRGDSAPSRKAREETTIAAPLGAPAGGSGWRGDLDHETFIAHCLTSNGSGSGSRYDAESETFVTAPTLRAQAQSSHRADSEAYVAHTLRGEGFDASEDGTGRGIPLVAGTLCRNGRAAGSATSQDAENGLLVPVPFDTTQITSAGNYSRPQAGDPCHPLAAGAHPPAIAFDCKASGRNGFSVGKIAGTQRAMGHAESQSNGGGHQAAMVGSAVRRLTPRECERLQGFPDDWTAVAYRGKPAADGPRYKALGNSMAVPVLRWIGERIKRQEATMSWNASA